MHSDPFRHSTIRYPDCAVNKSPHSSSVTLHTSVLSLLSSDTFLFAAIMTQGSFYLLSHWLRWSLNTAFEDIATWTRSSLFCISPMLYQLSFGLWLRKVEIVQILRLENTDPDTDTESDFIIEFHVNAMLCCMHKHHNALVLTSRSRLRRVSAFVKLHHFNNSWFWRLHLKCSFIKYQITGT